MAVFTGSCHCRSIRMRFETSHVLADLPVRLGGDPLSRRHALRLVSDPLGSFEIRGDLRAVQRYSYNQKLVEFVICRVCGSCVGVMAKVGDKTVGAASVACMDDWEGFAKPSAKIVLQSDDIDERRRQLLELFMPTKLDV